MRKLFRKPPEYSESPVTSKPGPTPGPRLNQAVPSKESNCEVNLNDIFEIIAKQDVQPAQFEVIRNPETGIVTLKEATADTPKDSHIVTSDVKVPIVVQDHLALQVDLGRQDRKAHQLQNDLVSSERLGTAAAGQVLQPGPPVMVSAKVQDVAMVNGICNGQERMAEVGDVGAPANTVTNPQEGFQSFKGSDGSSLFYWYLMDELGRPWPEIANGNLLPTLSGLFGPLDKGEVLKGNSVQTISEPLDEGKADATSRVPTEKTSLDFNVDLDALETLDINFDIINEDNNNKQQSQQGFRQMCVR